MRSRRRQREARVGAAQLGIGGREVGAVRLRRARRASRGWPRRMRPARPRAGACRRLRRRGGASHGEQKASCARAASSCCVAASTACSASSFAVSARAVSASEASPARWRAATSVGGLVERAGGLLGEGAQLAGQHGRGVLLLHERQQSAFGVGPRPLGGGERFPRHVDAQPALADEEVGQQPLVRHARRHQRRRASGAPGGIVGERVATARGDRGFGNARAAVRSPRACAVAASASRRSKPRSRKMRTASSRVRCAGRASVRRAVRRLRAVHGPEREGTQSAVSIHHRTGRSVAPLAVSRAMAHLGLSRLRTTSWISPCSS